MYTLHRGVNSYLNLGGQVVMLPGGAFYIAKSWVGNFPLCPPAIYAPDTYRQERGVSESSGSINSFCFCHPFMLQQEQAKGVGLVALTWSVKTPVGYRERIDHCKSRLSACRLELQQRYSEETMYRVYRFSKGEFAKGSWNSYQANMSFLRF